MRINQTKRIFMNEADSSPGNGAPVDPPAPTEPTAAPTAPALDVESLLSRLSGVIEEKIAASQNATFAALRKAGALGKDKPADDKPAPQTAAAPAQTGLSPADVKVMIERTRAVDRAAFEHKLTDAQARRMNAALEAEAPEDAAAWAKSYLADMGLVRPNETPTQVPATSAAVPVPQNGNPISDKGSPAPGGAVAWEREFAENPIGMSKAAYALMVAKHGEAKARQMRLDAAKEQAARIKVTAF